MTALGYRAAAAALYWGRRQDAAAIRASLAHLTPDEHGEVVRLLEEARDGHGLHHLSDDELVQEMTLHATAAVGGSDMTMRTGRKSVTLAPADTGTFSGYLAAFARDHQGDVIARGALDQTVADFKAGRLQWFLTDAHSERASDVVAEVADAAVDSHGLAIRGRWLGTERAQQLRGMVAAGAKLGLSIDYHADSRPDGQGGRRLTRVAVFGGAVTPKPMNPGAFIVEGKAGPVTARVVTVAQAIEQGRRRRDPDRDRRRREDELLAQVAWPPPGLFPRSTALALLDGVAEAAAARRVQGDPERARVAARRAWDNAYSFGMAEAMREVTA